MLFTPPPNNKSHRFEPVWETNEHRFLPADVLGAHPAYVRMVKAIPENVLSTFTAEQLRWLAMASAPQPSPHLIAYRASVKLLFKQYYVTIFAGEENRGLDRLRAEGQLTIGRRVIAYYLTAFFFGGTLLSAVILALYVVKTLLGINLFQDHSFLHDMFY